MGDPMQQTESLCISLKKTILLVVICIYRIAASGHSWEPFAGLNLALKVKTLETIQT